MTMNLVLMKQEMRIEEFIPIVNEKKRNRL